MVLPVQWAAHVHGQGAQAIAQHLWAITGSAQATQCVPALGRLHVRVHCLRVHARLPVHVYTAPIVWHQPIEPGSAANRNIFLGRMSDHCGLCVGLPTLLSA